MSRYLHRFTTEAEFQEYRENNYNEPWVSYTNNVDRVNYNKSEEEKLLGTPLTFEILGSGDIKWCLYNGGAAARTIEYKLNDGEWTSITSTTPSSAPTISVVSGDTVQFRGDNANYGISTSYFNTLAVNAQFKVKGNIMSLINSTDFSTLTTLASAYTFFCLFLDCYGLTDASKLILPATTLANSCYRHMFEGCTSLTTAPELPATTLASDCYQSMFYGCTGLTTAPSVLPATTLTYNCYEAMFRECTSLTTAPELPATTLKDYCYYYMFQGCTSLTTAPSVLPATTLTPACYRNMFEGCTSLTTAPELPATTLADICYQYMFRDCTNLNYVKCLATDISASNCTNAWCVGVQTTSGTFVKNSNIPVGTGGWSTGTSGIPTNWIVQDAS